MNASIVPGARPGPGDLSQLAAGGQPGPGSRGPIGRRFVAALDRAPGWAMPAGLFAVALAVYLLLRPLGEPLYRHFVLQADAWLHGRAAILYPLWQGPAANGWYQDVMPLPGHPGLGLIPYPPLPAIVMLPFVAIFGLGASQAIVGGVLGAVNVVLAWRMTLRLSEDRRVALATTIFFAFGTAAWYASMVGSTWYFAHVVALCMTLLAVNVALGREGDPADGLPVRADTATGTSAPSRAGGLSRADLRMFAAGLLLGLAGVARLTVVLGAPFLVLVGSGPMWRRVLAVGAGVAMPVACLLAYNLATTGALFHPAYAYAASIEFRPIPELYHADWGLIDPRYIPQNLALVLGLPPDIRPDCLASGVSLSCPLIAPDPLGMSLLLVSPAWLLAIPWAWRNRSRSVVRGAVLAIAVVGLANLAHFSQGYVQFGYRFSNDWAPFALVLVTLAIARRGVDRLVLALIGVAIAVNLWGVIWGIISGW